MLWQIGSKAGISTQIKHVGGLLTETAQHNQYNTKAGEMSILILPEIPPVFLWNIPS
jgi:hypothetical protein